MDRLIEQIAETVAANRALMLAIIAGCEIEHICSDDKLIIKTKYPIAIAELGGGRIVVGENKDGTVVRHELSSILS